MNAAKIGEFIELGRSDRVLGNATTNITDYAPCLYTVFMPHDLDALHRPPPDGSAPSDEVTRLLNAVAAGDSKAPDKLFQLIYDQLRAIAQKRMSAERPGHTLQATALVNEACVRLLGKSGAHWDGRAHFFGVAAEAMRQILIDHARTRNADKRGGGRQALSITSVADLAATENSSGFLALDEAILRLEKVDAQAARVVRLRFYAGLNEAAVAEVLGISERTVRRDWAFARGWLRDTLERVED